MNKVPERPHSDIRTEMLMEIYAEQFKTPGRKRDKLLSAILKMIERGFWNPGDRLPTDAEFSQILPLSVATIQAALKMAAQQDIVVRKQKNGTFVASEEQLTREPVFFNFRGPGSDKPAALSGISCEVTRVTGANPGNRFFGDDRPLVKITRVVMVDDHHRVMSDLYLADPRLRVLLDFDAEALKDIAIRPLLQIRFGLPSTRIEWRFAVQPIPTEVCEVLEVEEGTVGQLAEAEVFTLNDEKLMLHRIWAPPSDWSLYLKS